MYEEIKLIYPEKAVGQANDLTGKQFGKWMALYRTENQGGKPMWVCKCECENHTIKPVLSRSLRAGVSTSCGCGRLETISQKNDIKIHIRDENNNIIKKRRWA